MARNRERVHFRLDQSWLTIQPAQATHTDSIAACVAAAYQQYIPRLGKPPGPMLDDYAEMIQQHDVWVIVHQKQVIGLVVLIVKPEGLLLDNVAVHPEYQGHGLGRRLIDFAEAEAQGQGFNEINLYTHETMTENIAIYLKLGYVEVERRQERGYARVYMRKGL